MEFNASRQSFILSALLCVAIAAAIVMRLIFAPLSVGTASELSGMGMPLAVAIDGMCARIPWLGMVYLGVVTVWTLSLVVRMAVRYAPQMNRNYIPPQFFLIVAAGIMMPSGLAASLTAAWLTAQGMRSMGLGFQKGYRFSEVFGAGVALGLVPLLYAPALAIAAVAIPAGLAIFKRSGREAVVCLVGLALPIPAAGFIHWTVGDGAGFIYSELGRWCQPARGIFSGLNATDSSLPLGAMVVAGLVVAFLAQAAVSAGSLGKTVRKAPYKFMVWSWTMLAMVLASVVIAGSWASVVAIAAVPASLTATYAFSGKGQALASTLYCGALVAVIARGVAAILT